MPLPLIPIAVVGLGGYAWYRAKKRKGMTPERKKIYDAAMKSLKDPAKLNALADAFEKEGLKNEASQLRKRAKLRGMPDGVKAARRDAFKKCMQSKDPNAIEKCAKAFEKEGATGAATKLRQYAAGLRHAA
ncbi:MAG: hypothetical protein ACREBG_01890 [Pyrinomonadaceae bacterium]